MSLLFNTAIYLLSIHHLPLTLLGTGDILLSKTRCIQSWTLLEKNKRKPIYKLKYMVSNSDTNEEGKKCREEAVDFSWGRSWDISGKMSTEGPSVIGQCDRKK